VQPRNLYSWQKKENFIFSIASKLALVPTKPPSHWVLGVVSPAVKRPGSEADHSPPSSAEEWWSYTSAPQYVFMTWSLIKYVDNFTYYFTFTNTLAAEAEGSLLLMPKSSMDHDPDPV
jgi:hypothetical protein